MMYLETDPRAGINTGTSISVTETYPENFSNKNSTHILYRRHQSLVLLSSFTVGHIGGNGNQLCRKCHAGGTHEVKESDDGFHSLFEVGNNCVSFLVLTRSKYPAWWCSFCWRDRLGCRVPGPIGLSGCCPECADSTDKDRHQRCLHPILDWLPGRSSTNIAQGTPWTDYGWYSERTAHLGAGT